jgi:UTP--glucose-1-phosphate uridylyltransferase
MIKKVIIPVAGLGTRFLPATKAQPKEMLPIIDKPVIQFLVEEAVSGGIEDIIFVTGRNKRAIEDHFDFIPELESALMSNGKNDILKKVRDISKLARFAYVRQKEPKGDGDAILCAKHLISEDESVAVLFGDDIVDSQISCMGQMAQLFEKVKSPIIVLDLVPKSEVSKYGVVVSKKIGPNIFEITDIIEKPDPKEAPSNMVAVGKYIINQKILSELEDLSLNSKNKELRLSDAIKSYLKKGGKIYGFKFEGVRYDCGSKIGFLKATVDFALKHEEVNQEFKKYLKGVLKKN